MGITVSDKEIQDRLKQIKKQYFNDSDKAYQKQLKDAGPDAAGSRVRHQGPADLAEALRQGDLLREGLGRGHQEVLRRACHPVPAAREPHRAPHPHLRLRAELAAGGQVPPRREGQGEGGPAVQPDRGHRPQRQAKFADAREEVLAGSRLGQPGREAHDQQGPDGRAVRADRVPARQRHGLPAGQDAVRLPPDQPISTVSRRTRRRSSRWRSRSASSSSSRRSRRRWRTGSTR